MCWWCRFFFFTLVFSVYVGRSHEAWHTSHAIYVVLCKWSYFRLRWIRNRWYLALPDGWLKESKRLNKYRTLSIHTKQTCENWFKRKFLTNRVIKKYEFPIFHSESKLSPNTGKNGRFFDWYICVAVNTKCALSTNINAANAQIWGIRHQINEKETHQFANVLRYDIWLVMQTNVSYVKTKASNIAATCTCLLSTKMIPIDEIGFFSLV